MSPRVVFALAFLLLFVSLVSGQIPKTLSYQGVLTTASGNPKPDGSYTLTFRLYTVASGGSADWSETQVLNVQKGLFSAVLGSVTPLPAQIKFDQQYWLGIQLAPDAELTPRIQLTSVATSFNALRADTARSVVDSSVTGSKVAGGQIVRSINNLRDRITLLGANGAAVTSSGDTITIVASGGGGGGITALQNSDNALSITNPTGPTATINLKSPFAFTGSLGVGTLSPVEKLTVQTATSKYGLLHTDGTTAIGTWVGAGLSGATGGWLGTKSNHDLHFFVNDGAPSLSIKTGGAVGIGTIAPAFTLDVVGTVRALRATSNDVVVQTTGGTNSWARYWMLTPSQGWVIGSSENFNSNQFYLYDATFNMTRMSVLPNGGEITFPSAVSNHINIQTSGATNAWAQLRVSTASQTWLIGTSRDFNGNQLYFSDANGGQVRMAIMPNGNVGIGTSVPTQKLDVAGRTRTQSLEITGGGDLVEPFASADADIIEPGTVVTIDPDHPGMIERSTRPYDKRVAGIISGAGDVRPGLTLRQEGILEGDNLVAIIGRVYVKADATSAPIEPGDFLTTSGTPGHAMKATDEARSNGAIIGKAMTALRDGRGLILVLVNLQ